MIIAPPVPARKATAAGARPRGRFFRLAVALAIAATAAGHAADDEVRRSSESLERLRTRIQALEKTLEKDRGLRDEVREKLEATERRIVGLTRDIADLRAQIAAQTAQRDRTAAERREAETLLERHRGVLRRQVRAAYVIGQRGRAKLLLNQDHTERLSRVLTYYDYLNRARAARIRQVLDLVERLRLLEQQFVAQTEALEASRIEHEGTLTALEAARAERRDMVAKLGQRISYEEVELKQLRADEAQLRRLIRELTTTLADIPADLGTRPFAELRGKLPWPVEGKLLARYGEPKAGGALKWNGLWIEGREGEPVRAVARGRVAYVGWMHRYGLIAVVEHEGGYYSLYGHAQDVPVSVGDWVNAGDVIARVGATGGHEKSGLYFELRKGTDPVNPGSWLRKG